MTLSMCKSVSLCVDPRSVVVKNEIAREYKPFLSKRGVLSHRIYTKIESIEIPFQDHIVRVWTLVSDQYTSKVVEPRDQIIQMFREELALQQELAKQKTGGEEMTIQAGLEAVIAAARARLTKEWEVRVSPSLARFMGRNNQDDVSEYSSEEASDASE